MVVKHLIRGLLKQGVRKNINMLKVYIKIMFFTDGILMYLHKNVKYKYKD